LTRNGDNFPCIASTVANNPEMLNSMRLCTNMLATITLTPAKRVRIVDQCAVADQWTGEQASGEHGSYGIRGTTFKITFSEIE
jgi:hypothetical protein